MFHHCTCLPPRRFASEHVAAQAAAAAAAGGTANAGGSSTLPAVGDPLTQPSAVSAAAAAADVRRIAVRTYVVPLLIGLATTSSSTRAKLWASIGLDIFLQLLGIEVSWRGGWLAGWAGQVGGWFWFHPRGILRKFVVCGWIC